MIQGIGTDIIEIVRIENKIKRNPEFKQHVFSSNEITYCEKQKKPYMHYAARWAVKEAYLKAFSLSFIGNHRLHEIEVLHYENGKPYVNLNGDCLKNHLEKKLGDIHVSISHTDLYAVAYLIIEN
ncbi:MAG TPA: holo-ACP synthase [Chitinophagaceae bacterium]|nr:holo-ACP synthase [Chitinophagaceae bacterium]